MPAVNLYMVIIIDGGLYFLVEIELKILKMPPFTNLNRDSIGEATEIENPSA